MVIELPLNHFKNAKPVK